MDAVQWIVRLVRQSNLGDGVGREHRAGRPCVEQHVVEVEVLPPVARPKTHEQEPAPQYDSHRAARTPSHCRSVMSSVSRLVCTTYNSRSGAS